MIKISPWTDFTPCAKTFSQDFNYLYRMNRRISYKKEEAYSGDKNGRIRTS